MKHTNYSSLSQYPGAHWQVLGELELAMGANAELTIRAWLAEILGPLNLHADFSNKVLSSAREAVLRAGQAEAAIPFHHLHLLVFIPAERASQAGTWGFFRIEKVEDGANSQSNPDHAIEFYLYVEGQ